MHPHDGAGGGAEHDGAGAEHDGAGAEHDGAGAEHEFFGLGSTKTHVFLMIGAWHGSFSTLSIICGAGFLGCSVTLSMIVCGCLLTVTLSMVSPGGVGFLFTSLLTIGSGVGSLILSTFLFGGETLHSPPPHDEAAGAGGGHPPPQDILFIDLKSFVF